MRLNYKIVQIKALMFFCPILNFLYVRYLLLNIIKLKIMYLIKLKLSVSEKDMMYNYLINDVSVGIKEALKNKQVNANKKAVEKLEKLYTEINNVHLGIYKINYLNQRKAIRIGNEALKIINNLRL